MTGNYFLGVDGGQTSTTAIIGDQGGRVLGMGQGGPSNHVSAANFIDAITASLCAACSQAGLDATAARFASACLGFSGGPADKQAILGQILASDRILVTDDAAIALSGALGGEPGIVVIAGTGSIAFGRNVQGRTARAGGWAICLETKAVPFGSSGKPCGRLCAGRRVGDHPQRCGPCSWIVPAQGT